MRTLVQRVRIRRARLLVCISSVFRDHLVADYRFPADDTVVVPNPVRLERFASVARPAPGEGRRPVVLVLGRIAARKGIDDVVALAISLRDAGSAVRLRVVGGPSLWTDYTPLLDDLPADSAEYVGIVESDDVAAELAGCDILLQASHYEPFALTVAEALASGVPVVGTSEVGALEGVDRTVSTEVAVGDVHAMASAIDGLLARVRNDPTGTSRIARSEAERLFAPQVVCAQISEALGRLTGPPAGGAEG
jgi:glycosyltransferase involved in cell wall biosynthesis